MTKIRKTVVLLLMAMLFVVGGKNAANTVFASPTTTETTITDSVDSPLADAEADLIDGAGTNTRYIMGVCATAASMLILMGMGWIMADRKVKK